MLRMNILLAADKIHAGSKSVKLAKKCLEMDCTCQLTVLYVSNDTPPVYYRTDIGRQVTLPRHELIVKQQLADAVSREFRPWPGRVRFRHETGHPARTICRIANELDADLLILGGPNRRSSGLLGGSVVEAVLNSVQRPVLIAK